MTDDRRALAERLAQRVFDKYRQGQEERYDALAEQPSHDRERAILCVLAGLAHGRVAALDAVPSDFPRDPGETFTTDAVRAFVRRREREAARRGYEAGYSVGHAEGKVWQHRRTAFTPSPSLSVAEARDYYLDREYPAPSPPSVTLSDGSVVELRVAPTGRCYLARQGSMEIISNWRAIVHTGADFDAVKALAARLDAERAK